MSAPTLPVLSADDLDDLIYLTRTGDLSALKEQITSLCSTHACAPAVLLNAAIDADTGGDGSGSGCSLLHYPAANGNAEVLEYLISLLSLPTISTSESTTPSISIDTQASTSSAPSLLNHPNTSHNTPLHWASLNGHFPCVKLLVQAGADPWVKNSAGRNCMGEAEVAGENGREGARECVVWMLGHVAGVEEVGKEGVAEQADLEGTTEGKTENGVLDDVVEKDG